MASKKTIRLALARKLEHFSCLLEEAAYATGAEAECLSSAADAAVALGSQIEAVIDTILTAEAEVNIEAASGDMK